MRAVTSRGELFNVAKQSSPRLLRCQDVIEPIISGCQEHEVDFFQLAEEYREQSNEDLLMTLLIEASRYYIDQENIELGMSCLFECQYLLTDDERLLKSYVLFELGQCYELKGFCAEAGRYQLEALCLAVEEKMLSVGTLYLNACLKLATMLRDKNFVVTMQDLMQQSGLAFTDCSWARLRLVTLYVGGQYKEVLELLLDPWFAPLYQGNDGWRLVNQLVPGGKTELPKDDYKFAERMKLIEKQFASHYPITKSKVPYEKVDWQTFPDRYERDYVEETVVGYLMLDAFFYQRFDKEHKLQVIQALRELIPKELTFSIEQHGVWFYFKATSHELSLKGYLNSLLKPLFEKLGMEYKLSLCLPTHTKSEFSKTRELVLSGMYDLVMNDLADEAYQLCYCQGLSKRYEMWQRVQELLAKAHDFGSFYLKYNYFYHRQHEQLHCVEVQGVLEDLDLFETEWKVQNQQLLEMIKIQKELYTFQLGCRYLRDEFPTGEDTPYLFIKLSKGTLLNKFLTTTLLAYLDFYQLETQQIVINIDEDVLFEQNQTIETLLHHWHELGIQIGLDEYGAGSLTGSIRNLKINYLRISSTLMQYLNISNSYTARIDSLINVCSSRDVKVCCSNIETERGHHLVSNFGIEVVSGSYYQTNLLFN